MEYFITEVMVCMTDSAGIHYDLELNYTKVCYRI